MTDTISKGQIALVMGIVTAVAGGTWAVAHGQINHEREQYAACTNQLNETNEFIASLTATCDDRVSEVVTGATERLDACINKILVWNDRASSGVATEDGAE
jgi:hypothetical protein